MDLEPTLSLACALNALAPATRERPISLRQIAEATGQSLGVLERRMAKARRAELVKSVPGTKGGYYLVHAPSEITLFMVAECLGETSVFPCGRKDKAQVCTSCEKAGACSFRSTVKVADSLLKRHLSKFTIANFSTMIH